jgi:TonB family protein
MVPVEYPEQKRREDIEGQVKLWLTIDPSGTVIAVTPATEAPDQDFYGAAKRAALAQRWDPAKHDGNPVFIIIQYTYSFRVGWRAKAVPSGKAPDAE